jgi:hypothetical protein
MRFCMRDALLLAIGLWVVVTTAMGIAAAREQPADLPAMPLWVYAFIALIGIVGTLPPFLMSQALVGAMLLRLDFRLRLGSCIVMVIITIMATLVILGFFRLAFSTFLGFFLVAPLAAFLWVFGLPGGHPALTCLAVQSLLTLSACWRYCRHRRLAAGPA